MKNQKWLVPTLYIVFLMLPIYWLLNMSFKTTNEILGTFSLIPLEFTLDNYRKIFTDPTWYNGYLNSITYVVINTLISVTVALPAAYAFSRYRFLASPRLPLHGQRAVTKPRRLTVTGFLNPSKSYLHRWRSTWGALRSFKPSSGIRTALRS